MNRTFVVIAAVVLGLALAWYVVPLPGDDTPPTPPATTAPVSPPAAIPTAPPTEAPKQ
jgi:hypothetical protein